MIDERDYRDVFMRINNSYVGTLQITAMAAIGTIRMIQALMRYANAKKLDAGQVKNFSEFQRLCENNYDILNFPESLMELEEAGGQLRMPDLERWNIRYCIMPDLNIEDGQMQVAIFREDRPKIQALYEQKINNYMKGGEMDPQLLRNVTNKNVSIISIPCEDIAEKVKEDYTKLGINFSSLPDLYVGDGEIQFLVANADMDKAEQWFSLYKSDMLKSGQDVGKMRTMSDMNEYLKTAEWTEDQYVDSASEDLKEAERVYKEGEPGPDAKEMEQEINRNGNRLKTEQTAEFERFRNNPDYISISIDHETLVDNMSFDGWESLLANSGLFASRIPKTWGKDEKVLILPAEQVFQTNDEYKRGYIAFLKKNEEQIVIETDMMWTGCI